MSVTQGYASFQVEKNFSRVAELSREISEEAYDLRNFFSLWVFYLIKSRLKAAEDLAGKYLLIARKSKNSANVARAHFMAMMSLFHRGDYILATKHAENALKFYDFDLEKKQTRFYSIETGTHILSHNAISNWILGYPDRAENIMQSSLHLARRIEQPFTLADALMCASFVALIGGEAEKALNYAQQTMKICDQNSYTYYIAHALIFSGWTQVMLGRTKGIEEIIQGLNHHQSTGSVLVRNLFMILLAEAYGKIGQPNKGLGLLTEAHQLIERHNERWWEAELYRVKGDLLFQQTSIKSLHSEMVEQTQTSYLKAIEVTRHQKAKSFELRATTRLSHLWVETGKEEQALNMLSRIYGWFNEGFETHDLIEARSLLDKLNTGTE